MEKIMKLSGKTVVLGEVVWNSKGNDEVLCVLGPDGYRTNSDSEKFAKACAYRSIAILACGHMAVTLTIKDTDGTLNYHTALVFTKNGLIIMEKGWNVGIGNDGRFVYEINNIELGNIADMDDDANEELKDVLDFIMDYVLEDHHCSQHKILSANGDKSWRAEIDRMIS